MSDVGPTPVLRAVDRGAFAVALARRLRVAGVPVTFTALAAVTEALAASPPRDVTELYWLCRLTLVHQPHDLATFDRVFDVVFRRATLPPEGQASGPGPTPEPEDVPVLRGPEGGSLDDVSGGGLPWHTRPRSAEPEEPAQGGAVPELLPSDVDAVADVPFEDLDAAGLALVGAWLERSLHRWPMRTSRRHRVVPGGRRIALRETIERSRRTGWEAVRLSRSRPVLRPRAVTMLVDVSESMQPYATAYLHVMRALARTGRAETFAFSTALTRLTPALSHRSARVAMALATDQVTDRYGGTQLASSLAGLLASRQGSGLRGGVLVVASDGWDSEEPWRLDRAMRRASLRAHSVVWLNPRAAAPGFEPLVGSMAAALPYCDAFLPAHTLRGVLTALDAFVVPGEPARRLTTTA
jgi:uncharacterized protein with von Willebrand factor type A (vWA) domain